MAQGLRVHIIHAEDLRSQPLVWCPLQVSVGAVSMCTYPQTDTDTDTDIHNLNYSFKRTTWCDVFKILFEMQWGMVTVFNI